jgi:hypothetical protein
MHSLFSSLTWLLTGLTIPIVLFPPPPEAIAHQQLNLEAVQIMTHLEPDDSPIVAQPSPTWFHLKRPNGETIPLSDCTCRLVVYDDQSRPIAQPPLSEAAIEGHDRPIRTVITFPNAGNYQLILTGESKSEGFAPFEVTIPVTVRSSGL